VTWRPVVSIRGVLSGVVAGLGLLIVLQQASITVPTGGNAIKLVLGGVLVNLLLTNIGRAMQVRNLNRRLAVAETQMLSMVSAADAPVAEEPPAAMVGAPAAARRRARPQAVATFAATHIVPADGMDAWAQPDGAGTPMDLAEGLEVRVVQRAAEWARIETADGRAGWVDGRLLEGLT
jgi:hypothetical protein